MLFIANKRIDEFKFESCVCVNKTSGEIKYRITEIQTQTQLSNF